MRVFNAKNEESIETLLAWRETLRQKNKILVTTNGCFDLLHVGHTSYLSLSRSLGDFLVIGLNSDNSVRKIKGLGRPVVPELERTQLLLSLRAVNKVVVFDDLLPIRFIELIKPDIHTKGGDYNETMLPEAKVINEVGGKITILPLMPYHSTSRLISTINRIHLHGDDLLRDNDNSLSDLALIQTMLLRSGDLLLRYSHELSQSILAVTKLTLNAITSNRKLFVCGNGGSAAQAQHFATEMLVKFQKHRVGLPVISLSSDASVITAAGNDFGFEDIFSRQLSGLGNEKDVLFLISTSGESANILRAASAAHEKKMIVVGFTGASESSLSKQADICVSVPTDFTPQIQDVHMVIFHCISAIVERYF